MRGFSALEVLIASVILSTMFASCVLIILVLPKSLLNGEISLDAMWHLEDVFYRTFHTNLQNFSISSSIASTTEDGFTFSILATSTPDGLTKHLIGTVIWKDIFDRQKSISIPGVLNDFKRSRSIDTCGSTTPSTWMNPKSTVFTFAAGDLLPSHMTGTSYPVSNLAVSSTTLIALTASAQTSTDPTVFIFDISTPNVPVFKSAVDLSPSTKLGSVGAVIVDKLAYIASGVQPNFSSCSQGPACAQLQVLDIEDRASPKVVSNFKLPTGSAPYAIGTGGQSSGRSITYSHGRVYLGLTKTGSPNGSEFNIVDVQLPQTPKWLGGFRVGRTVTSIVVRGIYAYVTTDDPDRGLLILNVHDPAHITQIAAYRAPGTSIYTYAHHAAITSTTLAVGRTYAPNQPELLLLDVTDISTPILKSSLEKAASSSPWNIEGLVVTSQVAFVARDPAIDFLNIQDSSHPVFIGSPLPFPAQNSATDLVCANNTLYASSLSSSSVSFLSVIQGSQI